MDILFIVTSFWAYGEVTIACEFATRVRAAGYRPHFLIPPTHEKIIKRYGFSFTTLIPRNGKVNKILMKDLESRYHPSLVVLADFLNYNFCENHYGLTSQDLNIFSGKLGTFDNFDWVITGKQMDTYGFKAEKFGEIDIRKYGFSLSPCPVINPEDGTREETYHYALTKDTLPYDPARTQEWKGKLGLPTNKKLILFTYATWQESYKQYPDVIAFVQANNAVFHNLIEQLAKDHTVLCVGPQGYFSERTKGNFIHKSQLMPEVFDKYLLATDLFISRNYVATSLARAVLSGIPSVNFENSLYFSEKKPFDAKKLPFELTPFAAQELEKLERSYPYRMFPVGWFKFLAPVLKKNPYLKTFIRLEQFNVNDALEKMQEALESKNAKERLLQNVAQYKELLNKLPDVGTIVHQLIEEG